LFHHTGTVMKARCLLALCLLTLATPADATPYTLTPTDREAITTLARQFFEAVKRGDRAMENVLPTRAELRGMFPPAQGVEGVVRRHAESLTRDTQALHEVLRDATFVGITDTSYRRNVIDLTPCGRFARATTRCGDGPVIEYEVGGQRRRLRLDTLVRFGTRWRVFDVRP
jgi:hypothetical protein